MTAFPAHLDPFSRNCPPIGGHVPRCGDRTGGVRMHKTGGDASCNVPRSVPRFRPPTRRLPRVRGCRSPSPDCAATRSSRAAVRTSRPPRSSRGDCAATAAGWWSIRMRWSSPRARCTGCCRCVPSSSSRSTCRPSMGPAADCDSRPPMHPAPPCPSCSCRPRAGAALERNSDVQIWKSTVAAASGGPEADAWFSDVLQQPVRLVYLDDPTRRATNPEFSLPGRRRLVRGRVSGAARVGELARTC